MSEKKYTWHKLASSIEELQLPGSGLAAVELAGKDLCISLHKGQLHACVAKCPHASGNLAEGYIDNMGNIVCPVHRYRYNLENGHNSSGEGYYLKTYPVEQREDGIFVRIEDSSISGWLK